MRFLVRFFVFCTLLLSSGAFAQTDVKQPRILILLDGSSSMGFEWQGNEKRFDAASRIILKLIDSVYNANKDVEFALRVYGHQSPSQQNNCYDTKLEVMFSKDNWTQMSLRLASLKAIGVSPIAYSIKEAAENDLIDPLRNTYSLILVTDGAESCGGDICAIVRELLSKKIDFKPYILSLVDNTSLKSSYDCLGNYMSVTKEKDINEVVGKIVDNYKQMFALAKIDKKVLQNAIINAPSVQKINIPKVEIKQEVEVKEPPKPAVVTPPVVVPPTPVPPPAPKPLPKETLESIGFVPSSRSFPLYYGTPVPPLQKMPPYIRPTIQDEPTPPAPKPKVVTAPPVPKPVVKKDEPIQIVKAQEIKPVNDTSTPSGESTLQVYITDGKNFFETAPLLVVLDKQTKKEVMKFNRTVTLNGVPRPQKIPAGDYYLSIAGKETKYGYIDFHIKPNENKAIAIPIQNGSIVFSYRGNNDRPIKNYTALVFRRFESRPVVEQRVEKELQYEPGTYNVRINTLPAWNVSFDLNVGEIYGVTIPEEGTLIIANNQSIGRVNFYQPRGDKFVQFHSVTLDGSGTPIRLEVLPGTYKAGYKKNPQIPLEEETMQVFSVTSNNVTNLELNK